MNVDKLIRESEAECAEVFAQIDARECANTEKVLAAFRKHRVSARHFAPTTGYGYDDIGRDTLSDIFRDVFMTEAALARPQIVSGTHAISLCLFGILRPGDEMLSAAGSPYDTLEEIIGIKGAAGAGSLREFGIRYSQVELNRGTLDVGGILSSISAHTKLVLIQRSRGYAWRASLSVRVINEAIAAIHQKNPEICVMVDNCYGEFTDVNEPRADIMAGSLIKNPGGGLAPTGGYIAGKAEFVERVAYRLTSPGIGAEVGSYAGGYQPFYQGLFMAPHAVAQALKSAALAARVFERLGFEVTPKYDEPRNDIIEAIKLNSAERLMEFCRAIQFASPVDSEAVPEPWAMPGYQDKVIMAAGTFISGASIELSADAPLREPFTVYLQGALTYAHGKIAIRRAVEALINANMV